MKLDTVMYLIGIELQTIEKYIENFIAIKQWFMIFLRIN